MAESADFLLNTNRRRAGRTRTKYNPQGYLPSLSLARPTSEGFHHCLRMPKDYKSIEGRSEMSPSQCILVTVFTIWQITLPSMRFGDTFLIQTVSNTHCLHSKLGETGVVLTQQKRDEKSS